MARRGWHIVAEDGALTLARQMPVRFDLCVQAVFPPARKLRLAHQIRQDMWRLLQTLRGFSPVVRVEEDGANLRVTAGGRAARPFPKAEAEAQLNALLSDAGHRARWLAHARRRDGA
ncbi:hypothetical protein RGUI_1753 [Rhodovulum sp. P5]|uniref:hypothetical protein n=1 Tax=Rhodovulum sp. P5 TaxID=1564506 RepID=UPI0009C26A38|nr:hypothetical protein [Rhodovulum sp. P5]ARE39894.1 hypothetical protein RGUI_1753 [Rhodovulum sp. P5]